MKHAKIQTDSKTQTGVPVSRRAVIAGASLLPITALRAAPQSQTTAAKVPASVLSSSQRAILDALVDRLIPADENGPGAVESGVSNYIDRCLADYLANEKTAFLDGLASADALARSSQGAGLVSLSVEKRDLVLTAMETNQLANVRGFFNRLRRLTLEGMFGDPSYGGNRNFAGWDLIRYPGAKMASSPEDQRMKTPAVPYRKELYADNATGENHGH